MPMKCLRILFLSTLCLVLVIGITGCSSTYFKGYDPQSHFEYPNSNVIPLGKVVGEASRTALFMPPNDDSGLQKEAILNALKQKPDADILINFMVFDKRTDFLFIHTLTRRVEGTAAKMEIGTQKLY